MEGSPAVPGGSLTSKPTWLITCGWSATSVFLLPCGGIKLSRSPVMFAFDPLSKGSEDYGYRANHLDRGIGFAVRWGWRLLLEPRASVKQHD